MKANETTLQQIERALNKIAAKFPVSEESTKLTDIHLLVNQESGELKAFDDDDNEITRCVVEQWVENSSETFYDEIAPVLSSSLHKMEQKLANLSIFKPFSFTLVNEEKETICELYLVDDDTVMLNQELLQGLDQDLDDFLQKLLKD